MKPEWALRLVAECDLSISDAAHRLLCRILSHVCVSACKKDPWEPFPLTWAMVGRWCGVKESQSYFLLKQLQEKGYLRHEGVFGCPGQAHYRIIAAMAEGHPSSPFKKAAGRTPENQSPSTPKKQGPSTPKKQGASSLENNGARTPEKERHHISYSLREEMSTRRGRNGSLRSTGNEGGESSARRAKNGGGEESSLRSKVGDEKLREMAMGLAKLKAELKGKA